MPGILSEKILFSSIDKDLTAIAEKVKNNERIN